MAWNDLKAAVAAVIKTNGTQAITGALLQSTLNSIIDQVGANATFKGVATPSTNPGTPDGPQFYFAISPGTYSNFGGIVITGGFIKILNWDGSTWSVQETNILGPVSQMVFIVTNGYLEYNTVTKTIQVPSGYALPKMGSSFITVPVQTVDVSPDWGNIQYLLVDSVTGIMSTCKFSSLTLNLSSNKLLVACFYNSYIHGNFRYKIDGKEFGITFPTQIAYSKNGYMVTPSPATFNTSTKTLTFPSGSYMISPDLPLYKTPASLSVDLTSFWGALFYVYFDLADNTIKAMAYDASMTDRLDANHYIIACGYSSQNLVANFYYLKDGVVPLSNASISKDKLNFNPVSYNEVSSFPFQPNANGALLDTLRNTIIDINLSGVAYDPSLYYSFAEITVYPETSRITFRLYSSNSASGGDWVGAGGITYNGSLTETEPQKVTSSIGTILIIPKNWTDSQQGYQGSMNWNGYGISKLAFNDNYSRSIDTKLLDSRVSAIEVNKSPRIVLPSKIHAVVGKEFNLYYDSITLMPEIGLGEPQFIFDVQCAIGNQYRRGFRVTPIAGDVGSHTLTINVYDNYENLVESKTTTLVVSAASVASSGKRILCIGDSTTDDSGRVVQTLQSNFAAIANTPVFMGTHGVSPWNHEGRTGKTFSFYARGSNVYKLTVVGVTGEFQFVAMYRESVSDSGYILITESHVDGSGNGYLIAEIWTQPNSAIGAGWSGSLECTNAKGPANINVTNTEILSGYSPFKDNNGIGVLDISYYMTRFGQTGPIDIFDIDLGINDSRGVFLSESSRSQVITDAKSIIDAVLADYPNCKIIVNLPKMCASTRSDSPSQHDTYRTNIHRLRELIIENFDQSAYNANVYVSAVGMTIDRYYGYYLTTHVVGARYSETLQYHADDVHPRNEGYDQVADSKFAAMIYVLNN